MPYLTAAVALVGVVAIFTLLLVIALARRIRALGTPTGNQPSTAIEVLIGTKPASFHADVISGGSGGTVSLDGLSGNPALIGFFLAGCTPCNRQLPAFIELAKTIPGGRGQVVAVVTGPPEKVTEYAARLAGVASVVQESPRGDAGTITAAFSVAGWPCYYLLDPMGTIESSASSLASLAVPAAATAGKSR